MQDKEVAQKASPMMLMIPEALQKEDIEWPQWQEEFPCDDLLDTDTKLEAPQYYCIFDEDPKPISEKEAIGIQDLQTSPMIFWRLTCAKKKGAKLPTFQRSRFYNQSETYGYHMTVIPEFDKDGINYMTNKYQQNYSRFKSDQLGFSIDLDIQMVDLLNSMAQSLETQVLSMKDVKWKKEEMKIYKML